MGYGSVGMDDARPKGRPPATWCRADGKPRRRMGGWRGATHHTPRREWPQARVSLHEQLRDFTVLRGGFDDHAPASWSDAVQGGALHRPTTI